MKFVTVAIAGSVALASAVNAKESDSISHPQFKPYTKELSEDSFFEQFDSKKGWRASHAKKNGKLAYVGKWEIEESTINVGFKGDKGLVVKSEAALHAISVPLPKVFDNTNNTLVLQYEVKLQKGLECGGAYIKLLDANGAPDIANEFNNETPYQVMFGPDKCGNVNRVHFIIRRKNPNTGEYEEKALKVPPMARVVKTSVLYTLIIKPNQDFEIRIDGVVSKAGSLLDPHFFDITPPKEISDPDDEKPEDWVDEEYIRDPDATKPKDWDEKAPYLIPDPDAVAPEDWDEDAAEFIPDPNAAKPSYWDDDEDGEWEIPLIENPECEKHGCGPWRAPKVKNSDFKGKWFPPMIKNPEYNGEWEPKVIPNPEYYEDSRPSDLEPIGAVGFELWTMTNSILFDDIYIGHSIEEAEDIGNSTFLPKVEIEEKESAAASPKPKFEPEEPEELEREADSYISEIFDIAIAKFVTFLGNSNSYIISLTTDPVHTLLNRPGEAVLYSSVFLSFFSLIFGFWSALLYLITGGSSSTDVPVEDQVEKDISETKAKLEKIGKQKEEEEEPESIEDAERPTESEKNETEAVKR
ncbi:DEKNAAC102695 [Brettanomyces naardenensis]|uniref:DEKNAAC102695 n=1 Tax=Brettanomyces naardenensis TaxID=13370 RepID=A0A448YK86_BRENA|nr:DEKNAAC102695 [Brettanomyces naardenensis]